MTRRVRIAVSVFFAVLTVLLCVLWVRSYWTRDHFRWHVTTGRALSVSSRGGIVGVVTWTEDLDGVTSLVDSGPVAGSPPRRQMSNPLRFELLRSQEFGSLGVVVPYWFPIFITAVCVAIPWVLNTRRFSLRTLLIATTLVAVALALVIRLIS